MNKEELTQLLSRHFDRGLDPEEQARLERILETDAEARSLYMQFIDLEVELGCVVAPSSQIALPKPRIIPLYWKLAAAAALMLGIFIAGMLMRKPATPPTQPVAVERTAPDSWVTDFNNPNIEGWLGRKTTVQLPTGWRGALSSITITNNYGVFHQLRAPEESQNGLFTIHEDTHLQFTYRLETRAWFDLFLVTRSRNPQEPEYVLHIFNDGQLWSEAGRWRTATIPLKLFKRKRNDRFADVPPVLGEAPTHLFFSAAENGLQLTITDMRALRGGPGRLEIKDME